VAARVIDRDGIVVMLAVTSPQRRWVAFDGERVAAEIDGDDHATAGGEARDQLGIAKGASEARFGPLGRALRGALHPDPQLHVCGVDDHSHSITHPPRSPGEVRLVTGR